MITINGIKVGTTDITSTYSSGSSTKSFEVTSVSLGTISEIDNSIYSGEEIRPLPIITAVVNGSIVELQNERDYDLTYTNNVNVGQATVTATGKGNFTGTLSQSWNITGATLEVIANNQVYTYDGNLHGVGVSVTTVNDQPYTVRYRTANSGEYNLTTCPQFRDVINSGYNNVVYYQVIADNHISYEGTYQLQIYPMVAELSWGTLTWVYDGHTHQTTCEVSNLVSGDICTVELSNNSIINIGTETVTATGLSNSNYMLPSSDLSRTLSVSAGAFINISGTWTPIRQVYRKESGNWVEQNASTVFSTSEMYIKMN